MHPFIHSFLHQFIQQVFLSAFYVVGAVLGPFSRNLLVGRTDSRHICMSSSECSEVKKGSEEQGLGGWDAVLQRVVKEGDFSTKTKIKMLTEAKETGGGLRWEGGMLV